MKEFLKYMCLFIAMLMGVGFFLVLDSVLKRN